MDIEKAANSSKFIWLNLLHSKKFLVLFFLLTLVSFNSKILIIIRDALVITAPHSSAFVIPFIKLWLVLPGSIAFIFIFNKLSKAFSKDKVFALLTLMFLAYFSLFAFVLLPRLADFVPAKVVPYLNDSSLGELTSLVTLAYHWPYTLFFFASEMWTVILFSYVLWSFLGSVVSKEEGKSFYGLFSLDLAGVFAGLLSLGLVLTLQTSNHFSTLNWQKYIALVVGFLCVTSTIQILLFRYAVKAFDGDVLGASKPLNLAKEKKPSLVTRLKVLASDPLYRSLSFSSFAFEFCDHFLEIIWKSQIHHLCKDPLSFSRFMALFILATGLCNILWTLTFSSKALKNKSWFFNAMMTPRFVLLSSSVLFGLILMNTFAKDFIQLGQPRWFDLQVLTLVFATVQAASLKILKCTFFDNSKELAFLSLKAEEKQKVRALCDAFSSRAGKISSSLGWQGLTVLPLGLPFIYPSVGLFVVGVSCVWIKAIHNIKLKI